MLASVIVACHNEGKLLERTVLSTIDSIEGLDYEIVVTDDASTDDSVANLERALDAARRRRGRRRFPEIRYQLSPRRRGPSPPKDEGARSSRGEILVFLDGHCRPERGAIRRLVEDVVDLDGQAMVMPRIPMLDAATWRYDRRAVAFAYCMELLHFDCGWIPRHQLERRGRFYEVPACIGCALALTRALYERAWGFDPQMVDWGAEDIDLGLKAWCLGHDLLLDATVAVAHRFQARAEYRIREAGVLYNYLRMARKNFSDSVFESWVDYARSMEPPGVWERAWTLYEENRDSVEREREFLMAHRVRDEFDYAERFRLSWPRRRS
jgi:glycosyltransferase involved in cell wall biosynthesis